MISTGNARALFKKWRASDVLDPVNTMLVPFVSSFRLRSLLFIFPYLFTLLCDLIDETVSCSNAIFKPVY